MLSHTYAPELADVLVAFFFWLSAFVCFMALVVLVLLGVSIFKMIDDKGVGNAPAPSVRRRVGRQLCAPGSQGTGRVVGPQIATVKNSESTRVW